MAMYQLALIIFTIFIISTVNCKVELTNKNYAAVPLNFRDAMTHINLQRSNFNQYTKKFQNITEQNAEFQNFLKSYLNAVDIQNLHLLLPNVSLECSLSLFNVVKALKSLWAIQVVDSLGKPTSGVLQGHTQWIGEYRECINIDEEIYSFKGKYCTIAKTFLTPPNLIYGICIPQTCSDSDVVNLVNFVIEILPNITKIPIPIPPIDQSYVYCHGEKTLDTKAIVAIFILSAIVLLVAVGTLLDIFRKYLRYQYPSVASGLVINQDLNADGHLDEVKNESEDMAKLIKRNEINEPIFLRVLMTFSAYSNTKKLFHIAKNDDQLTCIHAIRYLSFGWVVLGHTFVFGFTTADNFGVAIDLFKRFSFQIILSGVFSVDSFFMLSGLLTAYLFLKELSKPNVSLSVGFMLKYYLHRIWRLTPPYAIVLMISVTLSRYFGDGPFYLRDGFEVDQCRDTWWTNLLYINNLFRTDKMCLGITWYLANDMQFHWIAPLMLIPFAFKKPIIAYIVASALIATHILSTGLIMSEHPGSELGILSNNTQIYMDLIYVKPWTRVGPFIVGILFGCLIFLQRKNPENFRIPKFANFIGWFISLLLLSLLIWGLWPDYNGTGHPLSVEAHIVYQSFSRVVWAIGLGFIIFSCVTSNGGFINSFLSLSFWTPLSRLSYSAYLIHSTVLFYFHSTLEHTYHIQDQMIAYLYIGHLAVTYTAAFFICIFFEIPMIGLEKFVFTR